MIFYRWKPPLKLSDCSAEYLTLCPVDYKLLRTQKSNKSKEVDPEEEQRLWQCLGVVRLTREENPEMPVQNPFYTNSVPALHSRRELRRMRRSERESKLEKWYDMPKPNVTEEEREDLEVIRLRRAIASDTHVKRSDTKFKYYQASPALVQGVVVDDPGSFYDRIPRKQRGKTIVDELLANADLMKKHRKRYAQIERATAEKRAALRRQRQQQLKRIRNKGGKKQSTVLVQDKPNSRV
ncbi:hypothetical protein EG68_11748 [Paragonimus skrjabini miyazakii]|uniref:Fcf2 pre-rRNA processing C-terminal domain-containing protein n=1 Tax=Paragonimus skrjabini miyazakii TaxID=59628 RepID=A0A8S9YE02_9TREM|nr:hypothetical protein EG68_11748 [Paragonimus skrjabini miyazakii]